MRVFCGTSGVKMGETEGIAECIFECECIAVSMIARGWTDCSGSYDFVWVTSGVAIFGKSKEVFRIRIYAAVE